MSRAAAARWPRSVHAAASVERLRAMVESRRAALLDVTTVPAYLVARKLLSTERGVEARALGGGVSNVVLAVRAEGRRLVVKQALPRLRVDEEWLADPGRAVAEAVALSRVEDLVPGRVPAVLDVDADACALVIEHAPDGWTDWKTSLLAGVVEGAVADEVGSTIGAIHAGTAGRTDTKDDADGWRSFEQLRLAPYHRTVAARHPTVRPVLDRLIERMHARRRCLVHGDCSPKNVLVGGTGLWLIDFEVAHRGDPTFDLAFMVSHLVAKAIHRPQDRAVLADACRRFLRAHVARVPHGLVDGEPWLVCHVAALLLARVDGKSPLEYLDRSAQRTARKLALAWLADPPEDLDEAWAALGDAA